MARTSAITGRLVLLGLVTLALGIGVGVSLGARMTEPQTIHGLAYSAEGAISVETADWTYGVPLDVPWTGPDNAFHEGGRPSCLPPSTERLPVAFEAVAVSAGPTGWRQVVWVDCRSVPIAGG